MRNSKVFGHCYLRRMLNIIATPSMTSEKGQGSIAQDRRKTTVPVSHHEDAKAASKDNRRQLTMAEADAKKKLVSATRTGMR
ncbi:hypothetical protein T265_05579 [Opisthorchis viverrini]|uniref:Uncharacterized protein n=1 Tax=Opisthorchis viverrini TaxID=6198 RepID=A0A075AF36_OPIVI|nr:hypothetical protein T265_05579 [Opisthorchis viverrini]KER27329.1 hypothetical protein T265_05579 [Opisthorchis viverrini]